MTETIGNVAAVLTTTAFVPQAMQTIRTRDTVSLSLWTWLLLVSGVLCWLAYGLALGRLPIIWANAVTAAFASVVLAVKVWNVWTGADRHRLEAMIAARAVRSPIDAAH